MNAVHHAINPYEFLGVNVDTPVHDIKKAFRRLALRHHEDKGGSKEAMTALNFAYTFIMNEAKHMGDANQDPNDISQKFQEYCAAQQASPMEFDEVDEVFHAEFERRSSLLPMTLPGGYGDFMQNSSGISEVAELSQDSCKPLDHKWTAAIIQQHPWVEESLSGHVNHLFDMTVSSNVQNFTAHTKTLAMSDYMEGFSEPVQRQADAERADCDDVSERLKDLTVERSQELSPSAYTWTLFGLVDSAGRKIRDFLQVKL